MSDIFGTPRPNPRPPSPRAERRRRVLVPTLVTLALLLLAGSVFTGIWTDRLWYKSLGFSGVFSTVIWTRILMFIAFGLIFGAVVMANIALAYRTRPATAPVRRDDPAYRYRQILTPILRPVVIVFSLIVAAIAGSVAAGHWQTFQMWKNSTPFGKQDAQFHKDISFYTFDYPWLRFLTSFGFALIVVAIIVVLFINYVYGGVGIANRGPRFSRAAQMHISVLVGLGLLLKAFSYWLDRFGLAIGGGGLIDGVTYTGDHARIPSKNILVAVAIVCALLFFSSLFLKGWMLPGIGLGLMVLSSILIGGIWPAVMQSFQVKPSEPDKEGPYIARNIAATRDAFEVSDVQVKAYDAKTALTPTELTQSAESRVSSRLLDPTLVAPAFEQLQQVRGYYSVPQTLDVDRYRLGDNKQPQDIIIAARELDLNGLESSQRNWNNDHTVYTHGYGVIAARGNQRGPQGQPVWVEKDIPPVGELNITKEPRIYYGEQSPSYSIVGSPKGSTPIEVDIPRGGAATGKSDKADKENATQNTYDGKGGVPVGSAFNKLLYAFKFGEPNIVLSARVNKASKILYDREPRERVNKVAPWLTVDGDPYPAVVDGRVVWIVDGYTTSNSYPYSQRRSLETATSDSLTGDGRAQAILPADQVNYIRNSVKAVVDAYDGTVKLYQWDAKDPVLKTWMKVFPGVVKPKSAISEGLLEHLRYPVDLFKVQRDVLQRYHVTDAQTFYEDGERWKVPVDPASSTKKLQPPYYVSITQPGETSPSFALTSVYLPNSRENLASFVSVNSEAADKTNYGKFQILQLPSDTQIPGPNQMSNQFDADKGVSQALLQYQQSKSTTILYGNLLTLPVGNGLLYVQPVYIKRSAEQGSYPVLQFVIASFGEKVGFGQTLDQALRVAVGLEAGSATPTDNGSTAPPASGSASKTAAQYLADASDAYNRAKGALKKGDLATYQKEITSMGDAIDAAQKALPTPKK